MKMFYDIYYEYKTNKITKSEAMQQICLNATQWSIAESLLSTSGSMAAEEYVTGVISQTNQEKEEQENGVQQSQTRVPKQQSSVRSMLRATRY